MPINWPKSTKAYLSPKRCKCCDKLMTIHPTEPSQDVLACACIFEKVERTSPYGHMVGVRCLTHKKTIEMQARRGDA